MALMQNVAIITARGGSKRIPRKNIKDFLGQPIMKYSIDAALKSKCFDEVMVSTDDKEIAEIALGCGAKVPFYRSSDMSDDFANTTDVILEVLGEYRKRDLDFRYCCCIYPTAPFITAEKLQIAYNKLINSDADTVVPVVRFSFPILRSFKIEEGLLQFNWPAYMNTRSQDLPEAFHDCGQFYFFRINSFLKNKKLFNQATIPYEMPELEVQDIDTELDWKLAEIKYKLVFENRL